MPDPITISKIRTLLDLVSRLVDSMKERRDVANAKEILTLVVAVQQDQSELQEQLQSKEREIGELKQRLALLEVAAGSEPTAEQKVALETDELAVRILQLLSQGRKRSQAPRELAKALTITEVRARHHADTLLRAGYLDVQRWTNGAVEYELSEAGREFVVAHNLDV